MRTFMARDKTVNDAKVVHELAGGDVGLKQWDKLTTRKHDVSYFQW